jgi:predicted kinase
MSELVIMVGIPGSGKSTYVQALGQQGYEIINPDAIRVELTGDMADQSQNAKVWGFAHRRLIEGLKQGKNMVLDATNVARKGRRELINLVRTEVPGTHIKALVKDISKETAIERVKKRVGEGGLDIPPDVMDRMYEKYRLNPPTAEEGFDEVETIPDEKITDDLSTIATALEEHGYFKEASEIDTLLRKE